MEQAVCERCGRDHAGSYGEYWYGTTDPHFRILGHARVFICNYCLQDTLLRQEIWLSAIVSMISVFLYGLCNFFRLHPEQLPMGLSLPVFEAVQSLNMILLMVVLALFVWNMASYLFRFPICVGWLRFTRLSHVEIRDLLAMSVHPFTEGYTRFTRSQWARLK